MSGAAVGFLPTRPLLSPANGDQDREAVFPTRQSLGIMKAKLKGAETGHSLLKRKSEALTKSAALPDSTPLQYATNTRHPTDDSEVRSRLKRTTL